MRERGQSGDPPTEANSEKVEAISVNLGSGSITTPENLKNRFAG